MAIRDPTEIQQVLPAENVVTTRPCTPPVQCSKKPSFRSCGIAVASAKVASREIKLPIAVTPAGSEQETEAEADDARSSAVST